MYRAKERGPGRVEVFDEAMRARIMERLDLENGHVRVDFEVDRHLTLLLRRGRTVFGDVACTYLVAPRGVTEWVRNRDGIWLLGRFNDAAHLESRRLYVRDQV